MLINYPNENISVSIGTGVLEICVAGMVDTNISGAYFAVGGTSVNVASDYPDRTFLFKIFGYASSGSSLQAQLYNLSDSSVVSTATISSTTPTSVENSISISGNKNYEVRISRIGGNSGNYVYLNNAYIKII